MSLEPGTRLGPYEILAPLGAGGMGEVYKARDTRLHRDVAIKVLPAHLSADSNARQRLEREARAVSALSHPNICTLHDVGQEADIDYLVIEYLEGETLADRLARGPLERDEMLAYAMQIVDALDKAHRRGLVHRDLKPGNVMLTPTGAKLLDFGLAKTVAVASGASQFTSAPTASRPLTAQGTLIGTYQYMAPEQLEGGEADERSDIFALGAVMFEMITGRKAFEAKTQAGVIAAIIERDPPSAAAVQPMVPPALDRLILTCMAKDPNERRQSMHDVLLDLKWIAEGGSQAGVPVPVTKRRQRGFRAGWVVATLLGVFALALLWKLASQPVELPRPVVAQVPFGADVRPIGDRGFALSPDGSRLVYSARLGGDAPVLVLRNLDGRGDRRLSGTEGAFFPFWSPDGKSIGFFAERALKTIAAAGGSPLKLCDTQFAFGGDWNTDGTIVFTFGFTEGIYRISANGGEPEPLTRPGGERTGHFFPRFLPDGRHFLFTMIEAGEDLNEVFVGSLDGDTPYRVVPGSRGAIYSSGHLVFALEDTLVAQPFDARKLELFGDRRVLAEKIANVDASPDGRIAYSEKGVNTGSVLTWYDGEGQSIRTVDSEQRLDDLTMSPSGTQLAVMRGDAENDGWNDVWTFDLDRMVFTRVTFDGRSDDPVFSPDGNWLVYATVGGPLYRKRANGAGEPELLLETDADNVPHDWSRDGRYVLFSKRTPGDNLDLGKVELGARSAQGEHSVVLATPFMEIQAQLSPDGRWVTYISDESGTIEVYVMSWPDLQGKWQVSSGGGGMPRWSRNGDALYYLGPDRKVRRVEVGAQGDGLRIGAPRALIQTRIANPLQSRSHDWALTSDGEEFVVIEPAIATDDKPDSITLLLDFLSQ